MTACCRQDMYQLEVPSTNRDLASESPSILQLGPSFNPHRESVTRKVPTMVPPQKKPRTASGQPKPATLPTPAIEAIIEYAVDGVDLEPTLWPKGSPPSTFLAIATLSKDWFHVIDDVVSARAMVSIYVNENKISKRSKMLGFQKTMVQQRRFIHTIHVDIGPKLAYVFSLLSLVPRVKCLVLNASSTTSMHDLDKFLRTSARLCPHVETLIMDMELERLSANALRSALEIWHTLGTNGGLGQVHLETSSYEASYVENFIDFCPRIQAIDGYSTWYPMDSPVLSTSYLKMDLSLWRRFCNVCTELTRFDWWCVPFATAYFDVFGATTKQQLKRLSISARKWKREEMDSLLRSMSEDDVAAVSQGGYGYLARHPNLILHACPNLEELHVAWDSRACCNVHIFDDTFFETLASTCRWLRTLHIGQVAHFAYLGSDAPETTGRISDSSLSVLGTMGRLRDVRVYGLHVGGEGLVNLMRGCSPDHAKPGLHVKIRTRESAEVDVFYGTVRSALARLLTCRGDALQCRRSISMDIRNTCHDASYLVGTESIKKLLFYRLCHTTVNSLLTGVWQSR